MEPWVIGPSAASALNRGRVSVLIRACGAGQAVRQPQIREWCPEADFKTGIAEAMLAARNTYQTDRHHAAKHQTTIHQTITNQTTGGFGGRR